MSDIAELYGFSTNSSEPHDWPRIIDEQHCPFLGRRCIKVRKSSPEQTIGSCTVFYGKENRPVVICPHRLLARQQVFLDCLHLLGLHEPGNELHLVSEVSIPGGSVDYFLVSARQRKTVDFVGIELQTLEGLPPEIRTT